MLYLGIDQHARQITISLRDENGDVLQARQVSTEPEKIQAALKATDLKADQLMIGYNGVKFDDTGQNILASTFLIQLKGKEYVSVWPADRATSKLELPMKGWR